MKAFLMSILALLILSGCSTNQTEANDRFVLETIPPNPEVVFEDPDYAVVDPPDGNSYQFIINDVTDEMFEQYVEACRNGIFAYPNCDIATSYQAYTEERDYWISVSLYHPHEDMDSASYIYVNVQFVEGTRDDS